MDVYKLEIACFNYQSALIAQQGGADRIELCSNMAEGGTTPDLKTLEDALRNISIDLFTMVRPRGGDFNYSPAEFEEMKQSIIQFKKRGVKGFVTGILNSSGNIDKVRNAELVKLAMPFPTTLHRAFDASSSDMFKAIKDAIECGFKTILTSGQRKNVVEGMETLRELITYARDRILILPGGGVRSSNIKQLKEQLRVPYYHSSAITGSDDMADINEVGRLKEYLLII